MLSQRDQRRGKRCSPSILHCILQFILLWNTSYNSSLYYVVSKTQSQNQSLQVLSEAEAFVSYWQYPYCHQLFCSEWSIRILCLKPAIYLLFLMFTDGFPPFACICCEVTFLPQNNLRGEKKNQCLVLWLRIRQAIFSQQQLSHLKHKTHRRIKMTGSHLER